MTPWNDLFLALPLPEPWLRALLFVVFGLHLLFVLLMLGTAMLGLFSFLEAWLKDDAGRQSWNKRVVGTHMPLKSLAVVLGVAPLLIIQIYNSEAFFTATGIFAYAWIAIIPLLIVAFLSVDVFGHKLDTRPVAALVFACVGLAALLTVPAVFTGALALMERPGLWAAAAAKGPAAAGFATHWVFRYLHVLGAAVVFGGVFHLVFSAKDPERRARMRRWTLAALLFQVVAGSALLATLEGPLGAPAVVALTLGVALAMLAAWLLRAPETDDGASTRSASGGREIGRARLLWLLPALLVTMLAARQLLQDQALEPERSAALAVRAQRAQVLAAQQPRALAEFNAKLATVYDNGKTIYAGSCQPCHGENGLGDGAAARRLLIPAEDLSAIRAERAYVRELLVRGVPGSAMPYFTVFDRVKIESLLDELDGRFAMLSKPEKPQAAAGPDAANAARVWAETCATCHAQDGKGSAFGQTLKPAPPDFSRYALTPERALAVITEGYPGTVMQPYRDLPDGTRRELAVFCQRLRVK
ncbi:MAG: hypothetical protein AUJ49_09545 [Desulfovibrionaceae bacterium CG1_02_65_16]|nr:MAG: hypothetical protein AUJ49_09545 [Desulfovibrionaceae bacterium CG1_02_65_16]